jgi:hypothetical protein
MRVFPFSSFLYKLILKVWIAILTILPCVLAALYFSNRYREIYLIEQPSSWFSTFFFYVFGVLLNQGKECSIRKQQLQPIMNLLHKCVYDFVQKLSLPLFSITQITNTTDIFYF